MRVVEPKLYNAQVASAPPVKQRLCPSATNNFVHCTSKSAHGERRPPRNNTVWLDCFLGYAVTRQKPNHAVLVGRHRASPHRGRARSERKRVHRAAQAKRGNTAHAAQAAAQAGQSTSNVRQFYTPRPPPSSLSSSGVFSVMPAFKKVATSSGQGNFTYCSHHLFTTRDT